MFIGHNGSVDTLCGVQIIVDFYFYAKCLFGKINICFWLLSKASKFMYIFCFPKF